MTEAHSAPSRSKRLRDLLQSKSVSVLMEAHNGLSAKLAQEAGFEALWGSGLSISAALGVRDNNEASWTQVLEVLEFMADASGLPLLLDGDTGYGNFNNVRRLVKKLEQRNIAGVCLEDKLFPKTNSFIDSDRQALADTAEFCGKLHAAKDTQLDPDFVVVARTEAFIAGWGLDEALSRATAYAEAGADAVLVHSKRKDSKEITAFMKSWGNSVPIVIVPTMYPSEPIENFVAMGVSNFIFANHSVRTVVTALQRNLSMLRNTLDLMSIENDIVPVSEVFRLQDVQELMKSEARYLPVRAAAKEVRAVVLAASKGDFGDLVADRPKAMLPLRGKPILRWHVDAFRRQGLRTAVVRGYCKDAVDLPDVQYFDNDAYATTGEVASLYAARDYLDGDVVITYGDIVFDEFILKNLLSQTADVNIAVDGGWKLRKSTNPRRDLVVTEAEHDPLDLGSCRLLQIGRDAPADDASGEWIGLLYLRTAGTDRLVKLLDELAMEGGTEFLTGDLPFLFHRLVDAGELVNVVHTFGHWFDLDDRKDLVRAFVRASELVQD
jgi:phosphoenolpyruvate phosphomutase